MTSPLGNDPSYKNISLEQSQLPIEEIDSGENHLRLISLLSNDHRRKDLVSIKKLQNIQAANILVNSQRTPTIEEVVKDYKEDMPSVELVNRGVTPQSFSLHGGLHGSGLHGSVHGNVHGSSLGEDPSHLGQRLSQHGAPGQRLSTDRASNITQTNYGLPDHQTPTQLKMSNYPFQQVRTILQRQENAEELMNSIVSPPSQGGKPSRSLRSSVETKRLPQRITIKKPSYKQATVQHLDTRLKQSHRTHNRSLGRTSDVIMEAEELEPGSLSCRGVQIGSSKEKL